MTFPTSHQPRSCVTNNFTKMGSYTQIWRFSHKFRQKIKSLLQSFIV